MPGREPFNYGVIRVVPRVERGEFLNAGVIVFCLVKRFLAARVGLDREAFDALWPGVGAAELEEHLEVFPRICAGDRDAGPIAALPQRERFHWLVAPRSTMVQISPVHCGLCEDPEAMLDSLFRRLVIR